MTVRWAVLTGEKSSGKSRLALAVAEALRARGVRVGGFVQERIDDGGADPAGYLLRRVGSDERVPLARRAATPGGEGEEAFCSFLFDLEVFALARAWIEADLPRVDAVVVDEVSKLEAAGRGHAAAIERALASGCLVILSVRADQAFAVLSRFDLPDPVAALETRAATDFDDFVDALRSWSTSRLATAPAGG